jgi:hypothetical protein
VRSFRSFLHGWKKEPRNARDGENDGLAHPGFVFGFCAETRCRRVWRHRSRLFVCGAGILSPVNKPGESVGAAVDEASGVDAAILSQYSLAAK